MDHMDAGYVGLERSLMVKTKTLDRLTKELNEANKKLKDDSVTSDKKTFLKAQMPKMETEIGNLKKALEELLEEDELDPRGEYFVLAQQLIA
mmetsp:Transcript_2051/g.4646  ORF Transcript_2051/g.4646 Transcript_2051/m.4646 type:complete len:92 (+) Transcript_2051:147-422(+)|eukprot:CAMPEP_0113616166 /NCGR_PEP_ID=MMETSP0017_2-20120614/8095_1 /TAXON_ID=2856 /ORGANISM="Cylindrotheca closterium" /LENGTH=91 /DNA_ID=CAMNT_0000525463 /DNA_START=72 /DNA_END=347 /DNA_ORIENTATION=- /assembly_acc=CAM_ASM_000147